jgi:hypothetical protein
MVANNGQGTCPLVHISFPFYLSPEPDSVFVIQQPTSPGWPQQDLPVQSLIQLFLRAVLTFFTNGSLLACQFDNPSLMDGLLSSLHT